MAAVPAMPGFPDGNAEAAGQYVECKKNLADSDCKLGLFMESVKHYNACKSDY
jgi:hypothetical protein